jgi:long-chain acyl-CoA synthetase
VAETNPLVMLDDLLARAAEQHPDRPALDFMGRHWRYRDLSRMVDRTAAGLMRLGVGRGDRVILCLPNTPYFVAAYFAVLRLGATVVSMNPLYTEREMAHLVRDSGARIAFVPDVPGIYAKLAAVPELARLVLCPMAAILPLHLSLAYRLLKRRSIVSPPSDGGRTLFFAALGRAAIVPPIAGRDPEDVAVLQYTGGTTGLPKGAMLSHRSLVANCLQVAAHDGQRPDVAEQAMGVLPMFHVFALTTVLNYSIHTAACIVLLPRFEMPAFLKAMARTRPERLFVVPTILTALNALPDAQLPPTAQLRMCISGGAPLPPEVRHAFERRSGARVVEGYGLSEASPIVTCNPIVGEVRDGSAGIAFPETVIEIRSLETGASLSRGEAGEVCVRGPQLMTGYWQRPDETAEVLGDGTLRTGDVGYLDADGYLFLVDRIKDLILCGGYNVYPRVIEDALYEHPAIAEAVVVGVPDPYRGEAPKAFVTLKEGASAGPDELRVFLASRISKIEMPREIELRDELPRTLIGKLSKKELRMEQSADAAAVKA